MDSERFYYIYDYRRDRVASEFFASGDLAACEEFSEWYNLLVRPDRWEGRTLGRYWLFERQHDAQGRLVQPRPVSVDENVRLDHEYFFLAFPPNSATEEAARQAEFDRLDGLDLLRLGRRGANVFAEFLDDGKRSAS